MASEKQGATYPQATETHPPTYNQSPPQNYPQQQGYPPQGYAQSPQHAGQQHQEYFQPQQTGTPVPQGEHNKSQPQMMQGTQGHQFQNVTPITALQRGPAPVDCPACGQRAMTNITHETGNTTHVWALALCCLVCLGCIPYCMNSTKDVVHKCGKCGVLLATWHRSGSTEVHIHN